MSNFSSELIKKWLKFLVYGPGGSGKTEFGNTFPSPRLWIDSEHSGDHIRTPGDKVHYTTSFKDLQDDVADAKAQGAASLIIDPMTIFRDALIDKVESNSDSDDGMTFRDWAKVKKPEKRLTTNWQNLPAHVLITAHEKDEYEMQINKRGKKEPVKIGVKPDADKKIIYAPDIVLRLFVKDGKHYGVIEKIRINKALAVKTGLTVGKIIENPTFQTFSAIVEAYGKGETQAQYTDDRDTSEKDEQVLTEIDQEQVDTARKKVIGQIGRGEKKCKDLNIYGWRDEEEIANSRKTCLGVSEFEGVPVEELSLYLKGLAKQVETFNNNKEN